MPSELGPQLAAWYSEPSNWLRIGTSRTSSDPSIHPLTAWCAASGLRSSTGVRVAVGGSCVGVGGGCVAVGVAVVVGVKVGAGVTVGVGVLRTAVAVAVRVTVFVPVGNGA